MRLSWFTSVDPLYVRVLVYGELIGSSLKIHGELFDKRKSRPTAYLGIIYNVYQVNELISCWSCSVTEHTSNFLNQFLRNDISFSRQLYCGDNQ